MRRKSGAGPSNFYPRPPRGGRRRAVEVMRKAFQFLSTPSARRATNDAAVFRQHGEFLSTPSARRATHLENVPVEHRVISIHALREEGDFGLVNRMMKALSISIHALREEGDWRSTSSPRGTSRFLSTPTARHPHFSPPPPRAAGAACSGSAGGRP